MPDFLFLFQCLGWFLLATHDFKLLNKNILIYKSIKLPVLPFIVPFSVSYTNIHFLSSKLGILESPKARMNVEKIGFILQFILLSYNLTVHLCVLQNMFFPLFEVC